MPTLASMSRTFREGTTISSSATVPLSVAGQEITITGDIGAADLVDPTLSFQASLWWFNASEGAWRFGVGFGWVGVPGQTEQPVLSILGEQVAGREVRVELSVPVRMRVGATLALTPLGT